MNQQEQKPRKTEQQVLQNLSVLQVEKALAWLDSPVQSPPPPELETLTQVEWYLLDRMLQQLQIEKQHNPLH